MPCSFGRNHSWLTLLTSAIDRELDPPGRTEVHYVETDLAPVQVALAVHVATGTGDCVAALVRAIYGDGTVVVAAFPPPGSNVPLVDARYRYEPGSYNPYTYHRLLECPSLNRGQW